MDNSQVSFNRASIVYDVNDSVQGNTKRIKFGHSVYGMLDDNTNYITLSSSAGNQIVLTGELLDFIYDKFKCYRQFIKDVIPDAEAKSE